MGEQIQSDALVEVIDRYCEVWNEPSAGQRAELLAQVWAPDATYTDPSVHTTTPDELLTHIENVRARRPHAAETIRSRACIQFTAAQILSQSVRLVSLYYPAATMRGPASVRLGRSMLTLAPCGFTFSIVTLPP